MKCLAADRFYSVIIKTQILQRIVTREDIRAIKCIVVQDFYLVERQIYFQRVQSIEVVWNDSLYFVQLQVDVMVVSFGRQEHIVLN